MSDSNRILNVMGILLNLMGGVLLTPEAIGIETLSRLEKKIATASKSGLKKVNFKLDALDKMREIVGVAPVGLLLVETLLLFGAVLYETNAPLIDFWIKKFILYLLDPVYLR